MTLRSRFAHLLPVGVSVALALTTLSANAATLSHTANIAVSPFLNGGSFNHAPLSIPKFNLAGTCLSSVCVRLDGATTGQVGFENYQAYPVTVNVYHLGTITLQRPDLSTIIAVQPSVTITDNLPVYDNVLDYGGLSGRTYFGVGTTKSDSLCLSTPGDLALFSGAGNISLPAVGSDQGYQSGASSWSIGVKTYGSVTVTYTYSDCPVPNVRTTWGRIKSVYR